MHEVFVWGMNDVMGALVAVVIVVVGVPLWLREKIKNRRRK